MSDQKLAVSKKLVWALTTFFQSWLFPLLALVIGFIFYAYGINQQVKWIVIYFDLIFGFLCLLVLASAIVQFWNNRWFQGIFQLGMMAFIFLAIGFLTMFYPDDYYADDLKLPKNISLEKPMDFHADLIKGTGQPLDSTIDAHFKLNEFGLCNHTHPGIYRYFARIKLKRSGTIYMKAFEVTHNDPLSPGSLKEHTSSKASAGEIVLHHQVFTIFEGDWGKPYAARFELWLDTEGAGQDQKLLEKDYLIEGWSR